MRVQVRRTCPRDLLRPVPATWTAASAGPSDLSPRLIQMEGLRPAFAGRIGLTAFSGGTLEKAESLGPGRSGLPAVGAEGDWGGTDLLHNR